LGTTHADYYFFESFALATTIGDFKEPAPSTLFKKYLRRKRLTLNQDLSFTNILTLKRHWLIELKPGLLPH